MLCRSQIEEKSFISCDVHESRRRRCQQGAGPQYIEVCNIHNVIHHTSHVIMMSRYDPDVQGVVVKYTSVKIKDPFGKIIEDYANLYCLAVLKAIVFRPAVGSRLSKYYISCIVITSRHCALRR